MKTTRCDDGICCFSRTLEMIDITNDRQFGISVCIKYVYPKSNASDGNHNEAEFIIVAPTLCVFFGEWEIHSYTY